MVLPDDARPALTGLAACLLILPACSGDDDPADPTEPATTPPATTTATATATSTGAPGLRLVRCDDVVDAVNADVVPLLATTATAVGGAADGLTFAVDPGGRLFAGTNAAGDEVSVLELTPEPEDRTCLGLVRRLPELGRGSLACVGDNPGRQSVLGQLQVDAVTVTAAVDLTGTGRRDPQELLPVGVALARTLAEQVG